MLAFLTLGVFQDTFIERWISGVPGFGWSIGGGRW